MIEAVIFDIDGTIIDCENAGHDLFDFGFTRLTRSKKKSDLPPRLL